MIGLFEKWVFFVLLTSQPNFKEEFFMFKSQRELALAISKMQRRIAAKNKPVIITGHVYALK